MNSNPVILGNSQQQEFSEDIFLSCRESILGSNKDSSLPLNGIDPPAYNEKPLVNNKKSVNEINLEENDKNLGKAHKEIREEHASFKEMTGSALNKKSFFTKTLEVLKKAGDVLWTPFNTAEKRTVAGKVLMLALAIAALVGATVLTGGAAGALVGLAAAGVAIASLDLASSSANYHLITHGKAGMRFAGDAIASAIYYLSIKIIDKTQGHRSEAEQTARRETAAKASHYLSLITRAALAGATAGITGLAVPLDPTLLQMNTHDRLVGGSINIVKALGDLLLKALTTAVPKEPTVPKKPEEPQKLE